MLTIRRISISIAADPVSAHLRHKLGARLVLRLPAGRIEPRRQGRHGSALQRLAGEQRDFGERIAPIGKEVEIDVILGTAVAIEQARAVVLTRREIAISHVSLAGPSRSTYVDFDGLRFMAKIGVSGLRTCQLTTGTRQMSGCHRMSEKRH
jgi:hypothetical protein